MAGFILPLSDVDDLNDGFTLDQAAEPIPTRVSLWPERWPAVALESCIEAIEAVPPALQEGVRKSLPCKGCPEANRCLVGKRKEVGSLLYNREYETDCTVDGTTYFPRKLLRPLLSDRIDMVPAYRKPPGMERDIQVVEAWDMAWSEKAGGDYLVHMAAEVNTRSNRRRLLVVERWQLIPFSEQVRMIIAKHTSYSSDLVVLEGDAAQQIWRQSVEDRSAVPVKSHNSRTKGSFKDGVPALVQQFEDAWWEFPYPPSGPAHEIMDVFMDELKDFTWLDGKLEGRGDHDDTVMCFWHLNWGIAQIMAAQ